MKNLGGGNIAVVSVDDKQHDKDLKRRGDKDLEKWVTTPLKGSGA